ncbi:hypothetical protein [Pseudonocardia sp.]|uniref:hypothetical protein n=1 Tax=Pseudonocardia sp. TaxID=60912 RepID=UPI00260FBB41|nr:hypothetical protein [Pseudonocardia sp.]
MACAAVLTGATPGVAAAQPPPCINYVHTEEAGRVEVDLRLDPATGNFSTLTIFWFINDAGAQPGIYNWSHVVNGVSQTPRIDIKDDNFHTAFRAVDGWYFGDTYRLQATHYSNATNTTYVAAVNECVITPR